MPKIWKHSESTEMTRADGSTFYCWTRQENRLCASSITHSLVIFWQLAIRHRFSHCRIFYWNIVRLTCYLYVMHMEHRVKKYLEVATHIKRSYINHLVSMVTSDYLFYFIKYGFLFVIIIQQDHYCPSAIQNAPRFFNMYCHLYICMYLLYGLDGTRQHRTLLRP